MKTTAAEVVFTATWALDLQIEPGSVPDRPGPGRAAAFYRPAILRLTFTTKTRHADASALRLENGSGFLRTARDAIKLSDIAIFGRRLKQDGTPGDRITTENFYGNTHGVPEWARNVIAETLAALGSTSRLAGSS